VQHATPGAGATRAETPPPAPENASTAQLRAGIPIALVLPAVGAVLALIGRKDIEQAAPPLPTETIASMQADVATIKERVSR